MSHRRVQGFTKTISIRAQFHVAHAVRLLRRMAQAFEGAQTLGELCHLGIPLLLERRARTRIELRAGAPVLQERQLLLQSRRRELQLMDLLLSLTEPAQRVLQCAWAEQLLALLTQAVHERRFRRLLDLQRLVSELGRGGYSVRF